MIIYIHTFGMEYQLVHAGQIFLCAHKNKVDIQNENIVAYLPTHIYSLLQLPHICAMVITDAQSICTE